MISIQGVHNLPADMVQRLRQRAQRAVDFFEQNFGEVEQALKIDLEPDSLSTGYQAESGTICFPEARNLINRGLESEDVLNHEIFHALVAQRFPATSTADALNSLEGQRLHEGLADFFAYKMNPDQYFGENYRQDKEYLRSYQNDLSISLSPGSHAQGNALTAYLLREQVELPQIRQFLQAGDFSLAALQKISPGLEQALLSDNSFEITQEISNYPASQINRYRIQSQQPLRLDLHPNSALLETHPGFRIEWLTMKGIPSQHYLIKADSRPDHWTYEISPKPESQPEKILACYYDGKHLLGSQPFYFSS